MALELAEGLQRSGISVQIVTSRWGSAEFSRRANHFGFDVTRLWLGLISIDPRFENIRMTLDQLFHWPALALGYGRFLKQFQPKAAIHTNWHHALLLWPFLTKNRDVFWLHEILPRSPQYRWVFQWLSRKVKRFVAVSQAAAASLLALGIPESQISVVYNGLTDPISAPSATKKCQRPLIIGIVGQIAPWKGHEDLLQAFSLVAAKHRAARLHVFGRGTDAYEECLRERVRQLALEGLVDWKGFVRDRAEIFGDLAVLAVPSLYGDPLPTTAIEAAFFAVPVVASRIGGLPEIVEHGQTGYLYDAGKIEELANYVEALLTNQVLAMEIGRNARKRAISVFSQERFVREFTELLNLR